MPQARHRFVEQVGYRTSPGHGDGPGWRERVGLPGGGPVTLITTLGVFRFDEQSKEAVLASYHPGQSVDTLRAATGWSVRVAPDVRETPGPTAPRTRRATPSPAGRSTCGTSSTTFASGAPTWAGCRWAAASPRASRCSTPSASPP